MSGQLRVKCPSCQAKLLVAANAAGKQMACPKCQIRFRLPNATAEPALPPMAIPVSQEQQPDSLWDGGATGFPDTPSPSNWQGMPEQMPQSYQAGPAFNAQPPGMNQHYPNYAAPQSNLNHAKPQRPSQQADQDLSEADSNMQSTGIFLVVIPILAAILPLFGLQLRRLARAGEYAPLGAMVLGFIGAGIIVYARRKRRDAPLVGASAVAVTLLFGVGGFLIQSGAEAENEPQANNNVVTEKLSAEELQQRKAESERRSREIEESLRKSNAELEALHKQEFGDTAGNDSEFSSGAPFGLPPATALANDSNQSSQGKANSGGNQVSGRPVDSERLDQPPHVMGSLLQRHSRGTSQFIQQDRRQRDSLAVKNFIGMKGSFGRLFNDSPVVGICGMSLGGDLAIIPINFEDTNVLYAVLPEGDGLFYGLRFAFDGNSIVGYQGLVQSQRTSAVSETPWYGRQTSTIQESLNPLPNRTGFVCYADRGKFCGFGWVEL